MSQKLKKSGWKFIVLLLGNNYKKKTYYTFFLIEIIDKMFNNLLPFQRHQKLWNQKSIIKNIYDLSDLIEQLLYPTKSLLTITIANFYPQTKQKIPVSHKVPSLLYKRKNDFIDNSLVLSFFFFRHSFVRWLFICSCKQNKIVWIFYYNKQKYNQNK